jgi:CDP-glycerol glycerophosphotransferase
MGIEQAGYPGGGRLNMRAMLRRCDRWDFSVTSNALSSEVWERAYPCGYETLEYGYPRNDRLVNAGPADVARVRRALGAGPADLVVLYAPTHRNHDPAYRPPFDATALAAALGPGGLLLVRSHYFNEAPGGGGAPGGAAPGSARVRDASGHASVEDLYLAADVLVTDYSSAMFDYGVLDRPIVIYAPDWAAFRAGRGVTFDLLADPPGAVAETFADLVAVFRAGAYADPAATAARAAFRRRFCSWDDGAAADRVVRRVLLGEPVPGRRVRADPPDGAEAPVGVGAVVPD